MGQTIGSSWAKSESQHTLAEVRFAPGAVVRREHVTFNHGVEGSSPSALTTLIFGLCFLTAISPFCQTGAQV
jgi:hypothetical protein